MTSPWKDLLFLHGHLLHRDDLEWRAEAAAATTPATEAGKPADAATSKAAALTACASVWPRIVVPH